MKYYVIIIGMFISLGCISSSNETNQGHDILKNSQTKSSDTLEVNQPNWFNCSFDSIEIFYVNKRRVSVPGSIDCSFEFEEPFNYFKEVTIKDTLGLTKIEKLFRSLYSYPSGSSDNCDMFGNLIAYDGVRSYNICLCRNANFLFDVECFRSDIFTKYIDSLGNMPISIMENKY